MYKGVVGSNAQTGEYTITATKSPAKAGSTGDYIAFDMFLRVDQAQTIYLTTSSNVIAKDGTEDKGLKNGTYYKYVVKAYKLVDGKKIFIAKSKTVHVTTAGGKYGNAKSVKVNKTSVNLTTGEKFKVKAKDKTIKQHVEIRYETSNSKVATVNSKGVITAKGKGTCYIYVYAQNGVYKRIKVTVK